MITKKSENGNIQDRKRGKRTAFVCLLCSVFCILSLAVAAEKWPGVDETVVEKYAKEHGRAARGPLINTDQGDLLLFVFLLAGTVGGFIAGYSWRRLMEHKIPEQERGEETGAVKEKGREKG